jgi:hypothetical protein
MIVLEWIPAGCLRFEVSSEIECLVSLSRFKPGEVEVLGWFDVRPNPTVIMNFT